MFYKFYYFAQRFSNDNRAINQPQISSPFGKISFKKLSVCFNKSTKRRLCLIQQFFSGTKDSKKDARMIAGVEGLPPVEMKHFLMSETWYIMNFAAGSDCQSAGLQKNPATFASVSKGKKARFVEKQHMVVSSR